MNGQFKIFIISALMMSFAACTNRTSNPVVLDNQSSDTDTDYSNANSNLFDTTGGTNTTINTSNLFDTNLTPTEQTQTNNTTTTTVTNTTTQQNICMNPNQNVLASSSTNSTLPTACYTGSHYLPQNYLLNQGYQSYGSMDYCFRIAAQYGQQSCAYYAQGGTSGQVSAPNYQMMFQAAQMAMIRCYRQVLSQQMMAAQWAPDQGQSYQGNDHMMIFLLKELMGN